MRKEELLKYVGSVSQIGGVRDFTFNDGKAKGVRAIEINTGVLRITVLPDRGMDIAEAAFKGVNVAWMSKAGITDSRFYEKDGKGFLRGFFGGLVTTCGLKNIGGPYKEWGLHDRISNTPAENISIFADWVDGEYVMKVSGTVRQSQVFGENLTLKRTITTKLYDDSFTLEDTVINNGFCDENFALAYHCNFGYPLVSESARIINVPDELSRVLAPTHGIDEACVGVEHTGEEATAGIENGDLAAYITYKRDTLPCFLVWQMFGESEYVIGLEPRTTNLGGANIDKKKEYVVLKPFEEYNTYLKFSFGKKD